VKPLLWFPASSNFCAASFVQVTANWSMQHFAPMILDSWVMVGHVI
jgi:hypothetical protein